MVLMEAATEEKLFANLLEIVTLTAPYPAHAPGDNSQTRQTCFQYQQLQVTGKDYIKER